jgi:hypothetical protein
VLVILNGLRLLRSRLESASYMIAECLTLFEAGNVLYSGCSDVFQSLARKESLATGNDHIRKSE